MEISSNLLIASAMAGSLARIPTHPLDTIKARMMASSSHSFKETLSQTISTEGIRGLYRGFLFTATTSMPASCLYFTGQEWSRTHLFSNALMSGFFAETISCLLYVPIDVVKERMQVQQMDANTRSYGSTYSNGFLAVSNIVRNEGIGGLYKGYLSTLASFGPFSALYFYFYELYRAQAVHSYGANSIPGHIFWLGGAVSGAAAAYLTTPLDLIKLRKQLDPSSPYLIRGSLLNGLKETLNTHGVSGLFRGASARVLFFSPTTAFAMALFETIKLELNKKDNIRY